MSRIDRTPALHGRRTALSLGTAAGAAAIAAFISMGSAPMASADILPDNDPLSDLIGALDPQAFNALGAPDDALGFLAAGLDNNLLAPLGLGALLDPLIDNLAGVGTFPFGADVVIPDNDPLSDLIGALDPQAFNALGAPDDALGFLAAGLDNGLLAPLGLGALLDPVIDNLVGTGTIF
jgi:hypothetical protein